MQNTGNPSFYPQEIQLEQIWGKIAHTYQFNKLVGRGSYGEVVLAKHKITG